MIEGEEEQEDGAVAGVVVPSNKTIQHSTHLLGDMVREDPPSTKITANGRWRKLFFYEKYQNSNQIQKYQTLETTANTTQQTAILFFYKPLFLVRGMACLPWFDCSWCW